jgi:O-antigen chain-terminating methyltransferase
MLFWYTPQIHAFHDGTAALGEHLCAVVERQHAALRHLHSEIANLRSELRVRGASVQVSDPTPVPASDPGYDHLLFLLQNRRSGPKEKRLAELQDYVTAIQGRTPPVPEGPWLDIGCGRGDWMTLASANGHETIGLEDNVAAIEHCLERRLNVIAGDPLATLKGMRDATYSVVAVLQVVERRSPLYVAHLLRAAARVLKPEGLLLFEADNPASLVSAAEELWADPAVTRPWPVSTAEFFLQYFGLEVVGRHGVRPYADDESLPFGELEFIQQLNSRLYAPRRYALLARLPAGALDNVA